MSELTPDEVRRRRLARLQTPSAAGLQATAESSCKLWRDFLDCWSFVGAVLYVIIKSGIECSFMGAVLFSVWI